MGRPAGQFLEEKLNELGGPPINMGFVNGALRQNKGDRKKAVEFLNKLSIQSKRNRATQLSGDYSRAASFIEQNPTYNPPKKKLVPQEPWLDIRPPTLSVKKIVWVVEKP